MNIDYIKENFGVIVWCLIIGAGIYFIFFHVGNSDNETSNTHEDSISEYDEMINSIASEYNAIILDKQDFQYSKDIKQNFDKRFLVEGSVHDIFERDGITYVRIDNWFGFVGEFEINEEQEKYIREKSSSRSIFDEFVMVVELYSVRKNMYEYEADIDGEDYWVDRDLSDEFSLKGKTLSVFIVEDFSR